MKLSRKYKNYRITLFIFFNVITIFVFSQNITMQEKQYGLSKLWSEVTYNFPYINELDFSIDSLYFSYIYKVSNSQSDLEYYTLLNDFVCQLHDGHSFVKYPTYLQNYYYFQIFCTYTNNKFYITSNTFFNNAIVPIGAEILTINQKKVHDYIDSVLYPSSPVRPEIRYRYLSEYMLFSSLNDSVFNICLKTTDGLIKNVNVPAIKNVSEWEHTFFTYPRKDKIEMLEDNILYISFKDFKSKRTVDSLISRIDLLDNSIGLIIDLRHCMGGTGYGMCLYKLFTDDTVYNEAYYEHRIIHPYKRARGLSNYKQVLDSLGITKNNNNYLYYENQYLEFQKWVENKVLTLDSISITIEKNEFKFDKPIIILIDEKTASAAELFVIGMQNLTNAILIGTPSYGSAGMPLMIPLPNGGMGQITTQKILYSDGKEFFGLVPDIIIEPTIEQILSKNDTILNYSISKINELSK